MGAGLRRDERERRVRGALGRLRLARLRARGQPLRQALCRLGDRERGQRPLLRAGARAHVAPRPVGRLRVLTETAMRDDGARYDTVAVVLHWLIGVALLGQIAFGLLLDEIAP